MHVEERTGDRRVVGVGVGRGSTIRGRGAAGLYRAALLLQCRVGSPGVLGWRPKPDTT